jgi:polysaccharide deacetylase 2 family uncharacterized protein YibQ
VRGLLPGFAFLLLFASCCVADGFTQKQADSFDQKRAEGSLYVQAEGSSPALAGGTSYIAIIIDDLGHNYSLGLRAAKLPAPLTYSILPYSTHATRLADVVHNSGKEVMIHLPMENLGDNPMGPGGLTNALSRTEFELTILRAVSNVPHARGINNHMGSALTQERRPMEWLMKEIGDLNFFFVDSRTTPKTIAAGVARRNNLLASSRDIFLDNDASVYDIDVQFRKLIRVAKRKGTAIAIGHPYPETLAYLELAIPQLTDEGIKIIPASNLVALRKIIDPKFSGQVFAEAE